MYSQIATLLFIITVVIYFLYLRQQEYNIRATLDNLKRDLSSFRSKFTNLINRISKQEEKNHNILKLYEINKKLATLLNLNDLVKTFLDELRRIRNIEEVFFAKEPSVCPGVTFIKLENMQEAPFLHVKCSDDDLKSQLPYLISQLQLLINRAKIYEKLQKISTTDTLTNIPNRRYFMERYEDEFNRSEKFKLNLSFLMVDIDHFKTYNDSFGHLVGDVILRETAKALKDNVREIDFIGRFGGEEFSVFLPQTSKDQAWQVAERLRARLADTEIFAYDEKIKLTVSIGLANFPGNSKDKDLLIEIADKALYKAKQEGRNRVCSF